MGLHRAGGWTSAARAAFGAALLWALPSAAEGLAIGPYVQDVRPDALTVVFETERPAQAELRLDSDDPADTPRRVSSFGTRHQARVERLEPDHRYRYSVWIDGAERERGEVGTAPAPGRSRPFSFVVYGDTRGGGEVERALVRAALADQPELALHTGDLVYQGDDEAAWRSFFSAEAPLLRQIPLYPAIGNHELYKDQAGEHFRRYFVLPDEGRMRHSYAFSWGAARFVVVDGNVPTPSTTAWLDRSLRQAASDPAVRHLFVLLHHAPFSVGGHCGIAAAVPDWVELFERYRVRAVFAGHDHAYEHLERNGVRYFVSGGGGARLYDERRDCPAHDLLARRTYAQQNHFLRVRVSGEAVEVQALALSGAAIETVVLRTTDPTVIAAAPPIARATASGPGGGVGRWMAGGAAAVLMVVVGLLLRRRPRELG